MIERGPNGMYINIIPEENIPVYSNKVIKAVRNHIDLQELVHDERLTEKMEIGTIMIDESKDVKINSSDIEITSIVDSIEKKYAVPA